MRIHRLGYSLGGPKASPLGSEHNNGAGRDQKLERHTCLPSADQLNVANPNVCRCYTSVSGLSSIAGVASLFDGCAQRQVRGAVGKSRRFLGRRSASIMTASSAIRLKSQSERPLRMPGIEQHPRRSSLLTVGKPRLARILQVEAGGPSQPAICFEQ
jgi:hypothetical protein